MGLEYFEWIKIIINFAPIYSCEKIKRVKRPGWAGGCEVNNCAFEMKWIYYKSQLLSVDFDIIHTS